MSSKRKPNVLWIFGDQMRAQAMSHRGDPNVSTPNIDRLAAEGVNFSRAVAGTPLCSPFRGSLLTGRYPHRSTVPGHDSPLSPDMPTIAHAFRANGYRTCWIGKWHLDGNREELDLTLPENNRRFRRIPPERRGGFEDWWAYENNNQPYDCRVHTDHEGETVSFRLREYETDALTGLLIDWLKRQTDENPDRPFFASLSVQPPHNPYVAPAECMARHNPAKLVLRPNVPPISRIEDEARRDLVGYYAAIERLDWNLGRIRGALSELGIAENTYIVFFSDHGDMHGSHGQLRKTAPWEESIRIPFIVGGPPREHQAWTNVMSPINHVDIAPTTLGLCGIAKPEGMDGYDYSGIILEKFVPGGGKRDGGAGSLPDSAYLSLPLPTSHSNSVDREYRGLATEDGWKYVVLEHQPWMLFNLNEDPYELVNLAYNTAYGKKRKELHDRLVRWVADTGDRFAMPILEERQH